jgi:uncharacterized membrane protein YoaK (UPF0700 family)
MTEQAGAGPRWAAVPLVALAGCVDGIGWLRLHEIFVSFMSGTSTLLGLALAGQLVRRAEDLALVVGLFAAGAVAGAALGLVARRWRSAAVLGLVAALLHAALLLPPGGGEHSPDLPPAALAMVPAMGALNTALPGVGGITFVTGALTRAGQALVAALAGRGPRWALAPQLAAWAAMVAGALGGGLLEARLGHAALMVPATGALLEALLAAAAAAGAPPPPVSSGRARA